MASKEPKEYKRPPRQGEGRPTDYLPEYCEQVIDFMAGGFSFEAFAGKIGVSKQTLYEWTKVHPEFSDAKNIAFDKCRLWWESKAIEGIFNENGRTFNSANFIYNMKCRFRDEWTERPSGDAAEGPKYIQFDGVDVNAV